MTETHTSRTVRGLKWSYISTVASAVLQIFLGAVLARLLTPVSFGLVAMAGFALRFGQYFAQMGLGSALVQKPQLSKEEIRAAFWASLGLGIVFCATFWLLAPLIGLAFRNDQVVAVVRALSLTFLLVGASTTAGAILQREMRFRAIAAIETSSYIIGSGLIGVTLALRGFGVWALVAAALAQSTAALVGYYAATRHDLRMVFKREAYGALLGFGSRVSGIGFLEFLGSNMDTLAVGRLLGPSSLGLYNRALTLANLPGQYLSTGLSRVLFPSLSRVAREKERLRKVFCSGITVLGALVLALGWAVAFDAHDVVLVLLGPKWLGVVPLLMITGIAAPMTAMTHVAEVLLEARAALGKKLLIRSVQVVLFGTALILVARFGLIGYAIVFTLSEVGLHVVYGATASREIELSARGLLNAYAPALVTGVVTALCVFVVATAAQAVGLPLPVRALLEFAAGMLSGGLLVLRGFGGRIWWTLRGWLARPEVGAAEPALLAILGRLAVGGEPN